MINAGVGEQEINNILAYMNLPFVNKKKLKNRERNIGKSFEVVAAQSCSRAVEYEIRNSKETDEQWVEVSADGGWQKRGTGHSNNSLSGHVTIVGKSSRKCSSFGVAKKCRFCKNAIRRKVPATKHKCGKNWTGSSKAMGAFLTLKCLQDLKRKGLEVNALTMDDDTSTYTRVKRCPFSVPSKNNTIMI
ncbi:uncharacterized protein LOC128241142 [Mya arenaria]|uniref:uncharacterized protein LOC128241142 n=1 Tax=Mya arenaria TaxID=6604 RepID=UPI0022E53A72|nr:uncharacterized protein LOC128241142 [Mya arenaria]